MLRCNGALHGINVAMLRCNEVLRGTHAATIVKNAQEDGYRRAQPTLMRRFSPIAVKGIACTTGSSTMDESVLHDYPIHPDW